MTSCCHKIYDRRWTWTTCITFLQNVTYATIPKNSKQA